MMPLKLLCSASMAMSSDSCPRDAGSVPSREFSDTNKKSILVIFPIDSGSGPVSWLEFKYNLSTLVSCPSDDGMIPVSWLPTKTNSVSSDN